MVMHPVGPNVTCRPRAPMSAPWGTVDSFSSLRVLLLVTRMYGPAAVIVRAAVGNGPREPVFRHDLSRDA
jgi:hypothetical protein